MPDFRDYLERIRNLSPGMTIREANLEDGPAFVDLFNSCYKRKTSIGYFKWQFFDSPFESRLFIAFDEDRLVGFYGIKIYPLTGGIFTGFAVDFMIDESYRKKGIGYLLEAEVEDFCGRNHVSVLSALPNVSGNAALKAMGWKSVLKIDTLIREGKGPIAYQGKEEEIINPATPYTTFIKNGAYREWRYDRHPVYQYEKITLDNNNFAVIKDFANPFDGKNYQDIVELHYERFTELQFLLERIVEKAGKERIDILTTWALPHTHLLPLLKKKGFTSLPQERFFCLKVLDEDKGGLYQAENWDLAQIDAEIF